MPSACNENRGRAWATKSSLSACSKAWYLKRGKGSWSGWYLQTRRFGKKNLTRFLALDLILPAFFLSQLAASLDNKSSASAVNGPTSVRASQLDLLQHPNLDMSLAWYSQIFKKSTSLTFFNLLSPASHICWSAPFLCILESCWGRIASFLFPACSWWLKHVLYS